MKKMKVFSYLALGLGGSNPADADFVAIDGCDAGGL